MITNQPNNLQFSKTQRQLNYTTVLKINFRFFNGTFAFDMLYFTGAKPDVFYHISNNQFTSNKLMLPFVLATDFKFLGVVS
ncbi:hypothetical protein [Hwangdonia seohaensis]|uniref:Uncharacterized protein n=1 Tax=Hwangdonia seohaensis TaxID=1240727 RepID=A0ABW3RAF0_9FLAO|nr:hypothetical protein [Hwangdonia seohaensis]